MIILILKKKERRIHCFLVCYLKKKKGGEDSHIRNLVNVVIITKKGLKMMLDIILIKKCFFKNSFSIKLFTNA